LISKVIIYPSCTKENKANKKPSKMETSNSGTIK
jgi:hypothetical protein